MRKTDIVVGGIYTDGKNGIRRVVGEGPQCLGDVESDISFECVTAGERGGARFAIEAIRQRLRQQVNGDTCTREEG